MSVYRMSDRRRSSPPEDLGHSWYVCIIASKLVKTIGALSHLHGGSHRLFAQKILSAMTERKEVRARALEKRILRLPRCDPGLSQSAVNPMPL